MKKLLIVLGSFTLVSSASLTVISCKTKDNKLYNQLSQLIGRTRGTYDDSGNPLTKSGASVIYLGARDNASSQSFEAALKNTFNNDLPAAVRELSAPWATVKSSNVIQFNAQNAVLDTNTWSITGFTDPNLNKVDWSATYAQVTFNSVKFDATFLSDSEAGKIGLQILNIDENNSNALIEAFERASKSNYPDQVYSLIKTYQYQYKTQMFDKKSELYNQWSASYQRTWLQQKNADRGVTDVKMQLRSKSNYYGAILDQASVNPTYGIKNHGALGINAPITVGLDYAQLQLNFQNFSVDKVDNYWNSDFFNRLATYLKEDILYQLGANSPISDGSEAIEKNIPLIQQRVSQADTIVNKIKEARGPLFLFVKNGHVIDVRKGWNQYFEFGGNENIKEGDSYSDLLNWAKEISDVWSHSALDNLNDIASDGIKMWSYVTADDGGASNWDWKQGKPSESK